jgi:hypothetical protein
MIIELGDGDYGNAELENGGTSTIGQLYPNEIS